VELTIHSPSSSTLPPLPHITSRRATPQPSSLERARSESARYSEVESVVIDRAASRDNNEPLPFGVQFPPSLGVEVAGCTYPYSWLSKVNYNLDARYPIIYKAGQASLHCACCLFKYSDHRGFPRITCEHSVQPCVRQFVDSIASLKTCHPKDACTFYFLFKTNVGDTA